MVIAQFSHTSNTLAVSCSRNICDTFLTTIAAKVRPTVGLQVVGK